MRKPEEMSDKQLDSEIRNHEIWRTSGKPYTAAQQARYTELLEARGQRGGLRFDNSLKTIERAARERRCTTYGALAEASGVDWAKAYRSIGTHMWDLVSWGHARGLPMLSAIVVNKEGAETGTMAPETLKGFINAAKALGKDTRDPNALLKAEQEALFAIYAPTDPTPE